MELLLIVVLFLIIILAFADVFIKKFDKQKALWIILFGLILIAGFRENTYDYESYVMIYNSTPSISECFLNDEWQTLLIMHQEIGYLFLSAVFKEFFDDSRALFIIMAAGTIIPCYYSFRRYSSFPIVTCLMYFSFYFVVKDLVQIRHGFAMSLFLYSVYYLHIGEKRKFFLCNLFASLFHSAVIPSLMLYPISKIKWNLNKIVAVLLICLIFINVNWVSNLIMFLFQNEIALKVVAYYESDFADPGGMAFWKYFISLTLFSIIGINMKNKYRYYNEIIGMLVLATFYVSIFHEFRILGERMVSSLGMALCLLFPELLNLKSNFYYKLIVLSIIFLISIRAFIDLLYMVGE